MPTGSAEMPSSLWGRMTWAVADCEAAHFCMGSARLLSGDFEQAIGDFDSAIECNSGSGRAYHARALAKELMGDSEGSDLDYGRARDLGYDESS